RQAAQLWQDRGRTQDLLWSGTAYRDYTLWRERYRGGLSATEEAFAAAATRLVGRQRRRRRIAAAVLLGAAVVVATVTSLLWRRATAETRRAEASKLLALAQLELEAYPTAALAYALKSLELADSKDGRLFALRVLQRGPAATVAPAGGDGLEAYRPDFSPRGEWVAMGGSRKVQLWHRDGHEGGVLGDYPSPPAGDPRDSPRVGFGPGGDILVTNGTGDVRAFAVPGGGELWRAERERGQSSLYMRGDGFFTLTIVGREEVVRKWSLHGTESRLVGTMETIGGNRDLRDIDARGERLVYARGRRVYLRSLDRWTSPPILLAEHLANVQAVAFRPDGESLAASDASGEIRIWPTAGPAARPLRVVRGAPRLAWDSTGRWLVAFGSTDEVPSPNVDGVRLWDLTAPAGAEPLMLRRPAHGWTHCAFDLTGRWLMTAHTGDAALWPLGGLYAHVLRTAMPEEIAFTPDGGSLLFLTEDGVHVWPLSSHGAEGSRMVLRAGGFDFAAIDPKSGRIAKSVPGGLEILALAGGPARKLTGFSDLTPAAVAFAPDGRRVAAALFFGGSARDKVIRIWDLATGQVQVLGPLPGAGEGDKGGIVDLSFVDEGQLLAAVSDVGLVRFDLRDGKAHVLAPELASNPGYIGGVSRRHDFAIGTNIVSESPRRGEAVRFSLDGGTTKVLTSHGGLVRISALDPTDALVATGSMDGIVRVGPASGGEPYYYFGHEGVVPFVRFSPDGRWLASVGRDGIRIWPVPDLAKPPFHTLPREELLARLRALTNLRVVSDATSPTGYKVEVGPFPGWAKPPEW
ncbi:MAG TPA: WD40 repeat domain-containing protein, partial [Vicinamibacteria bacterium]|nr:WD40 repeat domain-containing protein [Vicinamibacteria bacterium]